MKVQKGKMVAVQYRLHADGPEGELIEETTTDAPLEFIFGHEDLLEHFEAVLLDKQAGDAFEVHIKADDAYGAEDEDAIVEMPLSTFVVDGEIDTEMLQEGEMVPMVDEEGNELLGVVVEVDENNVVLDFNHPLAGIDLYFNGSVIEVREATDADWEALEADDEEEDDDY
ncbi:MAG: peptidylprolyl isomerase [Flavobacteriales bacterium]|jgi:FKBP-type peptidyl-prolyl cis-trans isomerase SlyD